MTKSCLTIMLYYIVTNHDKNIERYTSATEFSEVFVHYINP